MGQAESSQRDATLKSGTAMHILRVAEQSPASGSGIEPFFDFVCGINGQALNDDIDLLTRVVEQYENQQVFLQVYSSKRKQIRDVAITPSREWSIDSTNSSDGTQPSLLGLSLRLCNPQGALEQVWHVLEILEGSPAQSAGLVPFGDWIIGYQGGILRGEGDFYDVVESHVDKPLRLFVYNADYDVTRETILVPNRNWGGEGLLGCGVGYGLLHRIPKPQDRPQRPTAEKGEDDDMAERTPQPAATFSSAVPPPPKGSRYSVQSNNSATSSVGAAAPRYSSEGYRIAGSASAGRRSRETSHEDGYDEASYSGEYGASHGVSVVPVTEEEPGQEEDFTTFEPATNRGGYNASKPMNVQSPPRGNWTQSGYVPP